MVEPVQAGARAARVNASFRDPAGQVAIIGGRVIRRVQADAAAYLSHLLQSETGKRWIERDQLIRSRILRPAEIHSLAESVDGAPFRIQPEDVVLEHECIAFPSYPHEWSPEMLAAAGKLTVRLAREALEEQACLKDATPSNVLFRGPKPIFVDVLSFERRIPGDPTWLAHAQFIRTFLLPLLANKYFRIPPDQIFVTRRDGLEPEEFYSYLSALQKIRPPFLSLVSIPKWLARKSAAEGEDLYKRRSKDPQMARFMLGSLLKRMDRVLDRLTLRPSSSRWSAYSSNNNYTAEAFGAKERFVKAALDLVKPLRILDVGCNTGHFSRIAARAGASVVSIDYDPVVVGQLWRRAVAEGLDILPLVVDLSRPSPALGWLNQGRFRLRSYARGHSPHARQ